MIEEIIENHLQKELELEKEREKDYDIDVEQLEFIREKIESMNKFSQVEVLRLLKQYDNVKLSENNFGVTLNENKYGVHINLSELPKNIISRLLAYIDYVNGQELTLNQAEEKKKSYKNIYFTKDNKDMS
jgi:hypothetical protein